MVLMSTFSVHSGALAVDALLLEFVREVETSSAMRKCLISVLDGSRRLT